MFEGRFQEGEQQSTTLEEIEGVVSVQSFEMIIQWLYLGRVSFGEFTPEDAISATIELLRFADMCGITGIENNMADRIKTILLENSPPSYSRDVDTNMHCLTSEHILAAIKLPNGHPLRRLFAEAMVEGYLSPRGLHESHKFAKEIQEVPQLSVDLLIAVRHTLSNSSREYVTIYTKDPFSGRKFSF
jgi:hypothetical protein